MSENPLTVASISGIVFPALVVIMLPEGTIIHSIANILLSFFMGFLFIITIMNACGQKEIPEFVESYDIPLFEAFASSFGDEYAIVWKKTNELVDIPGNNGKLTYSEAHHILNDYLKHNPDKIWGIQIIPHVEIMTHILPSKETEPTTVIEEEEEEEIVSIVEVDENQASTDGVETISPIEEIIESPVEDSEDTLSTQNAEQITSIEQTHEISLEAVIEDTIETKSTEVTIEAEEPEELVTTDVIEEIDTSSFEVAEESFLAKGEELIASEEADEDFFSVENSEDLATIDEIEKIAETDLLEETPIEGEVQPESKRALLSNLPSPYMIIRDSEEKIFSPEEIEDLYSFEEEILPIEDFAEIVEVPFEDDEVPIVKREFLSNIPDPYIILDRVKESDKINDESELNMRLEEE